MKNYTKDMVCIECQTPFIRRGPNHICCSNKCVQKRAWRRNKAGTESERLRSADKYRRLGRTPRWRFNYYRAHAKNNGRGFTLSFEEFVKLISGECFYCGDNTSQMGVDRIDNSLGYVRGNVRTCCSRCNLAKGKMSEGEFYQMCRLITQNHDN